MGSRVKSGSSGPDGRELVELLRKLTQRPRVRDAPLSTSNPVIKSLHRGLPILFLERPEDNGELTRALSSYLDTAVPRRVPDVLKFFGPATAATPAASDEVEAVARVLHTISQELTSGRNSAGGRIRFSRFGLVRWLIGQARDPNDQDEWHVVLRSRMRRRDLRRSRLLGKVNEAAPELGGLADQAVPGLGRLVRFVPPLWFLLRKSGRIPGVGQEYRWLLRQPYMAPRDPGTVLGFAERLTLEQRDLEDPEQILRLLVRAFLSDVSRAYRRSPWHLGGFRRTTYPVVFLDGVSAGNPGFRLLRLINDVRNESGDFDPLVFVGTGESAPDGVTTVEAGNPVREYQAWSGGIFEESRRREPNAWFLGLRVTHVPPRANTAGAPARFEVRRQPFWAHGFVGLLAVLLAVTGLSAGWAVREHGRCAEWFGRAPSGYLTSVADECVGLADHLAVFAPDDASLAAVDAELTDQNAQAEALHRQPSGRPLITLVYAAAVDNQAEDPDNSETIMELAGMLAVQDDQNRLPANGSEPVIRILIGNAGVGTNEHRQLADQIARAAAQDPSLVGIVGLEESNYNTKALIRKLGTMGLPVISATLSADGLGDYAANYFHMAPENSEQARVIREFAENWAKDQRRSHKKVTIMCPDDPGSLYSQTLMADLLDEFRKAKDWDIDVRAFAPAVRDPGTANPGAPSPCGTTVAGQNLMDAGEAFSQEPDRLVVFAGRARDLETFLHKARPGLQMIADDDASSLVALRSDNGGLDRRDFRYVSFAYGGAGAERQIYDVFAQRLGNQKLKPEVDGHAAFGYGAVDAFLGAARKITGNRLDLNPSLLTAELQRSAVIGDDPTGRIRAQGTSGICILRATSNFRITQDRLSPPESCAPSVPESQP